MKGFLRKMHVEHSAPIGYQIPVSDRLFPVSNYLNQQLNIRFLDKIQCIHCGRPTKKSYAQGYCYPCFKKLAQCDLCIVKPETCHYEQGTCRDPDWARNHCLQPHIVYIANSSALKVGITRGTQIPTRWIDQGASQALPIASVTSRFHAGLIEQALKQYIGDRTDWRRMLKGSADLQDLQQEAKLLFDLAFEQLNELKQSHPGFEWLSLNESVAMFDYPVERYPVKVKSINLEKITQIEAQLTGIKGQYLIFGDSVINIRKYSGYHVSIDE